jgi:hypothetical protein
MPALILLSRHLAIAAIDMQLVVDVDPDRMVPHPLPSMPHLPLELLPPPWTVHKSLQ